MFDNISAENHRQNTTFNTDGVYVCTVIFATVPCLYEYNFFELTTTTPHRSSDRTTLLILFVRLNICIYFLILKRFYCQIIDLKHQWHFPNVHKSGMIPHKNHSSQVPSVWNLCAPVSHFLLLYSSVHWICWQFNITILQPFQIVFHNHFSTGFTNSISPINNDLIWPTASNWYCHCVTWYN